MSESNDAAVPSAAAGSGRLVPPAGGVTVRMYRAGHGDCFLLAFAGSVPEEPPVYVLIDCGYKPGSPAFIHTSPVEIAASILDATGGCIDIVVITHEHQDHVNGFTKDNLIGIHIGEVWMAWTEDPGDALANQLRDRFNDQLLGLLAARSRLAAQGEEERTRFIDQFLALELGGEEDDMDGAAGAGLLMAAQTDPSNSSNKQAMKRVRDRAQNGVRYIRPHEAIMPLPRAAGVRAYALGPPRDAAKLRDMDPAGDEVFHGAAIPATSAGNYFAAAVASVDGHGVSPFGARYAVPSTDALTDARSGEFFKIHYGGPGMAAARAPRGWNEDEVLPDAEWRRIDNEWLYSADRLALDLNQQTNNASVVLAFELGKGGKVLLFAADAQRGNWVSWNDGTWAEDGQVISARDLLARTVLYKVGHHCSENATLNGGPASEHPSLGWMGQGEHRREFTAMITAVRAWAEGQNGWDHPRKAIKDELLRKSSGRVLQTDTSIPATPPDGVPEADWQRFLSHVREDRLYFDYDIMP
ncbi:hypothetical protein [Longimicrobium terrae]|uniref:Uncharacterized protein n=1 Tax=Longimicrobium terrae TaxID=1639882 RepID=A0A841GZZ1_9BACT|nr:hypothetical protein [Longimicrobium terrae]MBB4637070.1 hypothetical protein [Longimicrobium terrae]MBB6071322.1 hypothetical protein [Longimicrobium terrae]NNC31459.1 hypothetical protein [Longimicrobium terrae]